MRADTPRVHWLLRNLRDVFAPRGCVACDGPVTARTAFCPGCAATVLRKPGPTSTEPGTLQIVAPFVYGGALSQAIRRLKFERRGDLAEPLGELLAAAGRSHWPQPWAPATGLPALVPVPSPARRLRERGFNPPALLAQSLSTSLGLPVKHLLRRRDDKVAQVGLSRQERLRNTEGAFSFKPASRWPRRIGESSIITVVLVDDVVTTGATLRACEAALSEAGVAVLGAITLAAADI